MSSVDFPRSPHSDAYAGTGLCCSHAAYCHFHMFECLDVAGFGGMGVCVGGGGGGGGGGGKCLWGRRGRL